LSIELDNNQVLLFVQVLDLWDLLVLFEMVAQLVERRDQIGDLLIGPLFAVIPQLFECIDHHNELLEGIDAEG
jgi:hypothetical protein